MCVRVIAVVCYKALKTGWSFKSQSNKFELKLTVLDKDLEPTNKSVSMRRTYKEATALAKSLEGEGFDDVQLQHVPKSCLGWWVGVCLCVCVLCWVVTYTHQACAHYTPSSHSHRLHAHSQV